MRKMKLSKLLPLLVAPLVLPFIALSAVMAFDQPSETKASYAPYQIPNGGFDSGNLNGWRAYTIWKGESGMAAFDAGLVTNGTYFGSNPYNRDGTHNLGITSGSITWDQSSERMGYLRSSDFILGGSGWLSFKLGGGKYPEFAYVSIRQTSDSAEVARFGNRWFNNTGRASTVYGSAISNAEAFLFPYYFDLSTVASLGTSLYIVLADTSAYDWSILSADSFVTYYSEANEPTPDADSLATNILPTIAGVGASTNAIVNGYFTDNDAGWTISGTGWGRTSASMRSNVNLGDAGIGLLRSTAFNVSTNKYIRFDWAGGLKNDKRIFISVKDVDTNIKVLRFVRRDNLSSKESNDFDNHMLNLSSLDSGKEYYLEFADNITGGWGVSFVDSIRIVTETEYNSVTSGDRAVSISGVPTSFALNASQEAVSYAAYFLEQTGPVCTAMSGDFDVIWPTLGIEYATLSDDAKNYFTASGTDDVNVVAARTRYLFIVGKYAALAKFVVDSESNIYSGAADVVGYEVSQASTITLVVLVGILVFASGLFFIVSRTRKARA